MRSFVSRLGALLGRLVLLTLVVGGTGVLVGTLFLPTAMAVTDAVDTVSRDVFDVPPLPSSEPLIENSFIYAADGSQLAEIRFEESRLPVPLARIPEVTINAVIATEDAEFWSHDGVNLQAIARAAFRNINEGDITQGGSTITQQYVKNAYIDVDRRTEQSYSRKLQEALWAIELERRMPKSDILEGYLNRAYFGNGVYGVAKAAEVYFSKPVEQLTLADSALLAGLIRTPEGNNPLRNPVAAVQRRDIVLGQMALHGFVTQEQADQAKQVELSEQLTPSPVSDFGDEPWWTTWILSQLTDERAADVVGLPSDVLDLFGETSEERERYVKQRGLRVHTTLDPTLQDQATETIRDYLTFEDETPEELAKEPLGAIVSVVPGDGAVRVMAVGPREFGTCTVNDPTRPYVGTDEQGRLLCPLTEVNPAVPGSGSGRQPGSAFKPFVITTALERGLPPGWQVDATGPARIPACDNGADWEVNNSGGDGLRDMYSGVKASSNVFHALLIAEVGPDNVWDMAHRLGFERDYRAKMDASVAAGRPAESNLRLKSECALALGAGDVFPLEMAAGYAALAAQGRYCQPYAITRIEDRDGNLIYSHSDNCAQVVDQDVATRVVDIMQGPVTPGGTAPFISGQLAPHQPRGKTGTTQDYRDAWFVGYVPQLATAAWIGYDSVALYDCDAAPDRCAVETNDCFDVDAATGTRRCFETRFLTNAEIGGRPFSRVFGGTIPAPMWGDFMALAVQELEPERWTSPGPLPGTTVPDFTTLSTIAEMEELADEARLNLVIEEIEDYREAGTVVGQSPEPGSRITAGNAVVVMISDGTGEPPTVPDVLGLDVEEAIRILLDAGYAVQPIDTETTDPDKVGIVLEQSPAPGTTLEPNPPASEDDEPPGDDASQALVVIKVGVEANGGGGDGGGDDDGGGSGGPGNGNGPPGEPSPPPDEDG